MSSSERAGIAAVTGATGFLGSVVCRILAERGQRVRAIYRNPKKLESIENLDVELFEADVTDANRIDQALEGVDTVYHVAALFREQGVPDSAFWATNVDGVKNVLDAAEKHNVRRVVHCSTIGVHSHIPSPPANEEEEYRPGDIYQETKCAGEKLALERFRSGRVNGCVVRPAMIWGPGDQRTLKLFKGIAHRRMPIIGDGKIQLHWVFVDDVAKGLILAGEAPDNNGEIYIFAGDTPITIEELFDRIAKKTGTKPIPFKVPAKPVQVISAVVERVCRPLGIEPPIYPRRVDFFTKTRSFDISKARQQLGYAPGQTLDDEIHEIVESYQARNWI